MEKGEDKMIDADADRFGELPDALIHQIYSFSDMKEVLGTTLLSKRWRYLWQSLPDLNFDGHMWPIKEKMTLRWEEEKFEEEKCEKFVDQVLLCRDGLNMQKLCLSYHSSSQRKLATWLDSALKQHVQELHLENMSLPHSFVGEVKAMVIKNCSYPEGTFTISSSRLEHLIVENCGYSHSCASCEIELCAPNLTTLQLKSYMFRAYSVGNLSALVTAEIYVPEFGIYGKGWEVCISKFSDICNGIRNVESLTLSTRLFKLFPELLDGLKRLPLFFNNVKHLKLTEWREKRYVDAMGILLGCFPSLEIIVLERTEIPGDFPDERGNWEAALSSDSIPCHLKVIEIREFDGCKNEYKFINFLLNNAVALEQITMKVTKSLSEEEVKDLV